MERKYNIGNKVKPIRKTVGYRNFETSFTHEEMIDKNQDYLYIVGFEEDGESEFKGEQIYYCSTDKKLMTNNADLYAESDLILI